MASLDPLQLGDIPEQDLLNSWTDDAFDSYWSELANIATDTPNDVNAGRAGWITPCPRAALSVRFVKVGASQGRLQSSRNRVQQSSVHQSLFLSCTKTTGSLTTFKLQTQP